MLFRLISWAKSFFVQEGAAVDLYSPSQRRIYRYFNGERILSVDPMVLYKKVMDVRPTLSVDIKVAASPSQGAKAAHNSVVRTIRGIFDVKSFEEGGLTEQETMNLFDHFMDYAEGVKKNMSPTQTSPEETLPSGPSPGGEGHPSSTISDSGSIEKESNNKQPTPLPSEPPSPSVSLIREQTTLPPTVMEQQKPII